jgi:hypothetical protein
MKMRLDEPRWRTVPVVAVFFGAWLIACHQFPETMHQVRLLLLLLAIGGPDS